MSKKGSDGSWIGIIICLWFFWPLGLFLLYKKLSDDKKTAGSRRKIEWIGVVLAILGLYRISELFGNFDAGKFGEGLFFLIGGCAVAGAGIWQRMRNNLYRKYKAIIGNRDFIDIETVARAIPTGIHKACRDIQSMIDSGMLGETAYIDMGKRRLVLDGSVYETAYRITQNALSPYDKAAAIRDYLKMNGKYTLISDYPPEGEDAVSFFMNEGMEGYCVHFVAIKKVRPAVTSQGAHSAVG